MRQDNNAAPLNPLPWVVWLILLPMVAVEVVLQLGAAGLAGGREAIGWRLDLVQQVAFVPDYYRQTIGQGLYTQDALRRLVTYPVAHVGVTHLLFVAVMLMALGKMVGEVFRPLAVLAVFFGASVAGALVYAYVPGLIAAAGLPAPEARQALIGGYPGVFGLIGAFTFLLWTRLAMAGANRMRAFALIGFLLATQALFGALFGGGPTWIADLGGFGFGFLASFVVSPGGWARVVQMMRSR